MGQIKGLADLRKAARVLSKAGCVNRRPFKLELDFLPFCSVAPKA
jgi:hypothetical protein